MISRRDQRLLDRHRRGEDHARHDDVRCYRCGRWRHPELTATTNITTAIGQLTVAVCADEADCQAHQEGP
jgi:hypothetical protein